MSMPSGGSSETPRVQLDADDSARACSEPLDLTFSPAGYLYATHPMHAFAARCPPPLVGWALDSFSRPGDVVLDPMVGSGTTLVEACLRGRRAWGAEIDPLARLIAKVKATLIPAEGVEQITKEISDALESQTDEGWRPDLPNLEKWFGQQAMTDLARVRQAIQRVPAEPDLRDLLWVAFSSLIVSRTSVANARDLVHSRHHFRQWTKDPDVSRRFLTRLRSFRRMMADYGRRLLISGGLARPEIMIIGNDARELPGHDAEVDLVFTSPPYCSAIDYTRAHMFAVAWMADALGVSAREYRDLGPRYVGSERAPLSQATPGEPLPPQLGTTQVDDILASLADAPKRAWTVYRYFRDMAAVIRECGRVIRPGGRIVLVVCPSNIRRISIPTHELFATIASDRLGKGVELEVEALHERTIHDRRRLMPYLESGFGPRMRTEYVLVLRRER